MPAKKLISVKEFCSYYNVDRDFIEQLDRNELIKLVRVKRTGFISEQTIAPLEMIIRLHNDLEVNVEGIETILHLLATLEKKNEELIRLRNQLDFYQQQE